MDDRGNVYENPTEDQIRELNLIRLPDLKDHFAEAERAISESATNGQKTVIVPPPPSRRERRAQERQMAKRR